MSARRSTTRRLCRKSIIRFKAFSGSADGLLDMGGHLSERLKLV